MFESQENCYNYVLDLHNYARRSIKNPMFEEDYAMFKRFKADEINVGVVEFENPELVGSDDLLFSLDEIQVEKIRNELKREEYQYSFGGEIPESIQHTDFRDLSSLRKGCPISDLLVDDWADHLIDTFNLSDNILYIPSSLYRMAFMDKTTVENRLKIINCLANNLALNKNFILVNIPRTAEAKHWMLGVIMLNSKRITILDPQAFGSIAENHHFTNLMRITLIAHKFANVAFKPSDWSCYWATKYSRQANVVDFNVYVCYYIYCIALNIPTEYMEHGPDHWRRRIRYVLSLVGVVTSQGMNHFNSLEVSQKDVDLLSRYFGIIKFNCKDYAFIMENSVPQKWALECPEKLCENGLTGEVFNQILCIKCRRYYHSDCAKLRDLSHKYFVCLAH